MRPVAPRLPSRALALCLAGALALPVSPALHAQAAPSASPPSAVRLPALGEAVSDDVSVGAEKRLGEQIMREIRRDPDYMDDAPLLDYLQATWSPLVSAARQRGDIGADVDTQFAWEAFLVRDRSVNAFALPGGYVGVHLGLIAMTATRDELASVLAHELSHVTQRHIARGSVSASRQGNLAMAAMILGMLVASRANNADVAQAAVMGSQAAAAQGQLNFSRDMEREADRVGLAVLEGAGFAGAGMAAMFEKLDHANRLNDSGAYPYLRSHPLTTERIGEARQRAASSGTAPRPLLWHSLMQARARVLMDPSSQALARLQDLDSNTASAGPNERAAALYASALASALLRDSARAERAWAAAWALPRSGISREDAAAERALALLGAQVALQRGDAARAMDRLARLRDDESRPAQLQRAQAALAWQASAGADQAAADAALRASAEALQTWTAEHRKDSAAWTALSQVADRLGLKLRAVRAEAESRAAIGDLGGAIDRLRAGQRLARQRTQADFIEASVIDARLRDLLAQQRQLMADSRGPQRQQPQE
ncbi:putative Zn-dependent protease [Burkholderiales bacterium JOSHI_001]|nr:putative Zn-dependent protease [Burkholderiales bacterium JOSHI_001]